MLVGTLSADIFVKFVVFCVVDNGFCGDCSRLVCGELWWEEK